MPSIDGVRRGTGRNRDDWFAVLDSWGAAGRPYREIADWLIDEHDLSKWWAQKLIVEYEQARGLRPPGIRRDGTFEVGTSKTMSVPVTRLFDAFVNDGTREKWLTDGTMSLRSSQSARSARFDWEDGSTRVNVDFVDKGPTRSAVSVAHRRLDDADAAKAAKEMWKQRLANLKSLLEA